MGAWQDDFKAMSSMLLQRARWQSQRVQEDLGGHRPRGLPRSLLATSEAFAAGNATTTAAPGEGEEAEDSKEDDAGGDGDDKAKDGVKEGAWRMTRLDKMWLQVGWIAEFLGYVAAGTAYFLVASAASRSWSPAPASTDLEDDAAEPAGPSTATVLVGYLNGEGFPGLLVSTLTVVLSLMNFYSYSVMTEARIQPEYRFMNIPLDAFEYNEYVEKCSMGFFVLVTVLRLAVAPAHPEWRHFGCSATIRYVFGNVYMSLEVCALVASLWGAIQIAAGGGKWDHCNFLWLFMARSFEMLQRSGMGVGVRKLQTLFQEDGKLLLVSAIFGVVVWFLMSSMYYVAHKNGNGRGGYAKAALWEYAVWQDGDEWKPWRKFESIPSSMWFVLINLLKEHPIADAQVTALQRLLVCFCNVFAVPIFALPTSILQNALLRDSLPSRSQKPQPLPHHTQGAQPGAPAAPGDSFEAAGPATAEEAPPDPRRRDAVAGTEAQRLYELMGYESAPPDLQAAPDSGHFWQAFANATLAFFSIIVFFAYTARDTEHYRVLWLDLRVTSTILATVDGTVGLVFALEWLTYALEGGQTYLLSGLGIVDLLAWVPGVVHMYVVLVGSCPGNEWLRAACVLRVLKLERYLQSFYLVAQIACDSKDILCATCLASFLLWIFCSTIIYQSERWNPDPEMFATFGSNMRSLWAEIINLHGEFPWCDYTARGKGIGTGIGLFSIMLFCIPISIFGEGFVAKIQQQACTESRDYDRRPWQYHCRPAAPGLPQRAYDLLYGHLRVEPGDDLPVGFRVLRFLSVVLTCAATAVTLLGTVADSELGPYAETWKEIGYAVDVVAVVFFALEFGARVVATGLQHAVSVVGMCDILSTVAIAATLDRSFRAEAFHPDFSRQTSIANDFCALLRALRLFSLESYLGALHVLRNVLYLNRWPLTRAGGALVATWFIHATLLYLFERPAAIEEAIAEIRQRENETIAGSLLDRGGGSHGAMHAMLGGRHFFLEDPAAQDQAAAQAADEAEEDAEEGELPMSCRYQTVPRALQYSIVHLFGDFPTTDYTFMSKIVHAFGIMLGMAMISTFCGVFSASFVNYLTQERAALLKHAAEQRFATAIESTILIQAAFRRRRGRRTLRDGDEQTQARKQLSPITLFCRDVSTCKTARGRGVSLFFTAVLVANLVHTLLASLPELDYKENLQLEKGAVVLELLCTLVFTVEYVIRIVAMPRSFRDGWRVFDLLCLLPGWVLIPFAGAKFRNEYPLCEDAFEAALCVRAIRLLNIPYFQREVMMVGRSLKDASRNLSIPAYTAVTVWVTTSCLFMWLENYYKDEGGEAENMTSVPATMYWTSIYLTGEWANVDFTYAGSRLCIFYVVFGVTIFSIPMGIIIESWQSTLKAIAEEEQSVAELLRQMTTSSSGAKPPEPGEAVAGAAAGESPGVGAGQLAAPAEKALAAAGGGGPPG